MNVHNHLVFQCDFRKENPIDIAHIHLIFPGCNRTYFGETGKTYDLELHRPKEDKIPFICHLTFTAGGDEFGDLVQVCNVIKISQRKNTTPQRYC